MIEILDLFGFGLIETLFNFVSSLFNSVAIFVSYGRDIVELTFSSYPVIASIFTVAISLSVVFGILLVPGLYALFQTWRERVKRFFSYLSTTAARRRQLKERK